MSIQTPKDRRIRGVGALPQRWTVPRPSLEAFRACFFEENGHTRSIAQRLGLTVNQIYGLRRIDPTYDQIYREWCAASGRRRTFRPFGAMMRDVDVAKALDASTTYRMAAKRLGYTVNGLWQVARRMDMPMTTAAYARLRQRKVEQVDPRPRLLQAAIDRIAAAMPVHGHITKSERQAVAEAQARSAPKWPALNNWRSKRHSAEEIARAIRLASLIPHAGMASRAVGAWQTYVTWLRKDVPAVDAAWRRAEEVAQYEYRTHLKRQMARDTWSRHFGPEVRKLRAQIIDDIVRVYGTVGAYERAHAGKPAPSRTSIERWMREDTLLCRPSLYTKRPRSIDIVRTCDVDDARNPAMTMRQVASGDRWWQWGLWVAWVGDHNHSARLMLEHSVAGNPLMVRRLERVDSELWTRAGWVVDSPMARWDEASNAAIWRPL